MGRRKEICAMSRTGTRQEVRQRFDRHERFGLTRAGLRLAETPKGVTDSRRRKIMKLCGNIREVCFILRFVSNYFGRGRIVDIPKEDFRRVMNYFGEVVG